MDISIHALYGGRLPLFRLAVQSNPYFNPRPLRRATKSNEDSFVDGLFQSTPSTEGDSIAQVTARAPFTISIHALYGGRPFLLFFAFSCYNISIHALYGGRQNHPTKTQGHRYFNPRPLRRATKIEKKTAQKVIISIHALYGGRPIWCPDTKN